MENRWLKGKVALITGAARGIGKAISLKIADEGAAVAINDIVIEGDALDLKKEIEKMGGRAEVFQSNVADQKDVEAMVEKVVNTFGSLDILVNNAGISRDSLIMRMEESDWDAVLSINLKGAYNTIKAVSRIMIKQKSGAIVNISSVVGVAGNPGQASYSASKAGLIGLTKTVAKELAGRGIRANAVAPGFIQTEMTDKLPEEVKEKYVSVISMNRFGTPEEVADLVAYLSSDRASYITGEVIRIDGGMLI